MYVAQCHEPWPVSGQGPFQCTDTDTQDINRQDGLCTAAAAMLMVGLDTYVYRAH